MGNIKQININNQHITFLMTYFFKKYNIGYITLKRLVIMIILMV